jgi:hypothetical protein
MINVWQIKSATGGQGGGQPDHMWVREPQTSYCRMVGTVRAKSRDDTCFSALLRVFKACTVGEEWLHLYRVFRAQADWMCRQLLRASYWYNYCSWLISNEISKQCVLAAPAARQHLSRQVAMGFRRKERMLFWKKPPLFIVRNIRDTNNI